ncbi:MAG TPA: cytochrome c-type biogenesis protein CcmH [Paracoccaceae bacterium]|nr:cytochrome c-type biogenesis protein CcmH [Paracoccaceae bacterium]
MRSVLLACFAVLWACAVWAVQPDEVLDDPILEARARAISALIRCPVCQGESIDESNAGIARDLRLVLRERLVAGDSDDQVIDYLVARYGEFILFRPRASGANLILWIAGPAMLAGGLAGALLYLRRRRSAATGPQALTTEEEARITELLKE